MAIHKQCERMPGFLETDIKYLKGVGDARAKVLASELGVATFRDLRSVISTGAGFTQSENFPAPIFPPCR